MTVDGAGDREIHSDRFELRRRLGAGGMGIVYEAFDRDRNAAVALKTLKNVDAQSLYRLKREFRALQDLQHPNLVSLGELIEASGQWFFTMELVHGVDFQAWVRKDPDPSRDATESWGAPSPMTQPMSLAPDDTTIPPPRERVAATFDEGRLRSALMQLGLGLHALHAAGKVHRDIKPSNIMVTTNGRVVLLDFGLIHETRGERQSTERHVVGTAAFMAPEQAASRNIGPEADWYSVGVVLYQALTGRLPFVGSAIDVLMKKQTVEPPPPSALATGVPDDLDALCAELLRFDPRARPTGEQVLRRLGIEPETDAGASASMQSFTQTPPFVGRARELDALRAAFDATRAGEGVIAYVRGESGVGKSALIRQLTSRVIAEEPRAVVLAGRCYERESVPYKAFDGVVDELSQHLRRMAKPVVAELLPRNAALLPLVFPVLGRVEPIAQATRPRAEARDPREQRNRMFAALRELFTRLAESHPLIVVIDDLQWADADSLQLLGDLMRPPESPPLLLIASVRETENLREVTSAVKGDVRHIELGRLPPAEAQELAALLLRRVIDDTSDAVGATAAAAANIAAEAAGHPLFIDELVRHANGEDLADRQPVRLDDAIWDRVQQLAPEAARLLEFIALAGTPLPQEIVCMAAEVDAAESARELAVLRVANLVRASGGGARDRVEPYHDRVRESVLAHLDDGKRMRCHARLAVALEASGVAEDHPEVIVRHLEAAGRAAEATERAEQAAERASVALAFDRAAELFRTALRLGERLGSLSADARRRLQLRLGEALGNAGRGAESADAYLQAAEGADPAMRLECQRRAAEQLLTSGHIDRGLDAMGAVLAEVGVKMPTSSRGALASLLWTRAKLGVRGLRWRERHESEIAPRDLTRLDVYKSAAHGLGVVDTIRGADFQARGLLLALKVGERKRVARALAEAAAFASVQGGRGIKRARELLATSGAIAEQLGDPYLIAHTLGCDGITTYFEGQFRVGAERLLQSDLRFVEETTGAIWELNTVRLLRQFCLRRLGWYRELGDRYDAYLRDAVKRGDHHMETSVRWSCNDVWLARGDVAEAHRDLDSASWIAPEARLHLQHFYNARARAEVALYEGDEHVAEWQAALTPVLGSLLAQLQDVRSETLWTLGRCALAAGDVAAAARFARKLGNESANYSRVWGALLDAGIAYPGDGERALRALRHAQQLAEQAEMELCAATARRRRGELLGGDEGRLLVETADTWMDEQAIANPDRMTACVAPVAGAA